MIFIDSNIPIYLVGSAHANKTDAQRILESLVVGQERLVTNAEVFQEILHRYVAINRRDVVQPAFDTLRGLVEDIFPIELADVERAKAIVQGQVFSARDGVHLATMQRHGIKRIMTFDAHFDAYPGIARVH